MQFLKAKKETEYCKLKAKNLFFLKKNLLKMRRNSNNEYEISTKKASLFVTELGVSDWVCRPDLIPSSSSDVIVILDY